VLRQVDAPPVVLVVEDDADFRDLLAGALRSAGYAAHAAPNGQEALIYLAGMTRLPVLVVMDMRMPVMDGRELLTVLRSYPRLASIPVLLISAAEPTPSSDGMVAFLRKPFDRATFIDKVRACLSHDPVSDERPRRTG
jgi:CheY-like chemotaxis protein